LQALIQFLKLNNHSVPAVKELEHLDYIACLWLIRDAIHHALVVYGYCFHIYTPLLGDIGLGPLGGGTGNGSKYDGLGVGFAFFGFGFRGFAMLVLFGY
jgi:hypothetical protein